jgi:hypothetical protein
MPTTIFTATLSGSSTGNQTNSTRNVLHLTGDTQGQIRVTFQAGPSASWKVTHAAFQQSSDGFGSTSSAGYLFQELFFGGSSGFNLSTGQSITSDWLPAWQRQDGTGGGNRCVIVTDDDTAGNGDGGNIALATGVSGAQPYNAAATSSYNAANPGGFTSGTAGQVFGISKIETQGPTRSVTLNWVQWSGPQGTPINSVTLTPGTPPLGYGNGGGTIASGDLLIAVMSWGDQTQTGIDAGVIVPPSGWTSFGQVSTGVSENMRAGFFYKIAGPSEPSSYTFTVTTAETAAYAWAGYSGASIDAFAAVLDNVGSGTSLAPSVSPTNANDLLVCFFAATTAQASGWPTSMYVDVSPQNSFSANVSQAYVAFAEQPLSSSGATGTRAVNFISARRTYMLSVALSAPSGPGPSQGAFGSSGPGIIQRTRMIGA